MSGVVEALRRVVSDLAEVNGRAALVGGLAVSARAEPRFTRDLDLAVAVSDDQEAERLVFTLQGRGYRVQAVLEHEGTGRLATVRLIPPLATLDEVLVDLLFATTGVEDEIVARSSPLEVIPGLVLPVASVGHLLAMKVLSHDPLRRPRDAEDLLALLGVASGQDLVEAERALSLIAARGFDRGKDLMNEFEAFRTRAGELAIEVR